LSAREVPIVPPLQALRSQARSGAESSIDLVDTKDFLD